MSMPCQSDWKLSKLFQDRNKKLGSFLVSKYFETRFFSWRRCGFQFVSLTSAFIPLKATFLHTANHSHSSPADCEKKPRFHLLRSSSAIFTQVAGNPVLNIRAREKRRIKWCLRTKIEMVFFRLLFDKNRSEIGKKKSLFDRRKLMRISRFCFDDLPTCQNTYQPFFYL